MEKEYRYILEKGSKKTHCPECGKKAFVLYIDTETSDYLPEQYGRCDREGKCGYHLNPYSDGYAKMIWEQEQGNRSEIPISWKPQPKKKTPRPEPIFFDFETFKQTLERERYSKNDFIQNLLKNVPFPFNSEDISKVIEMYRLGTVAKGNRTGAITFPFIDKNQNVRTIQVKQFDKNNKTAGTDFLHSILEKHHTQNNMALPEWLEAYSKNEAKVSCLFGEHLLSKYPDNPIALVEAPKTAIYSTLYFGFPETSNDLIWLAVYNKSSFSFNKLKVLKGRFVYVFSDLSKDGSTFKEWETKAKDYQNDLKGTQFAFSDLLEKLAPKEEREKGNDLADFLIKLDWRQFRKNKIEEKQNLKPVPSVESPISKISIKPLNEAKPLVNDKEEDFEEIENWDDEIKSLKIYFKQRQIPIDEIQLNNEKIIDASKFFNSHLKIVVANNGNKTFKPYLQRLLSFKTELQQNINH